MSVRYKGLIKLDIDRKAGMTKAQIERFFRLALIYDLELYNVARSSNGGWHLWLRANKDITELEVLLVQIFLGSHLTREWLNFVRWLNGAELSKWNILFTEKYV